MINKDKILQILRYHFHYTGQVDIQDDGVVNIDGSVRLPSTYQPSMIPVKFGTVAGNFDVRKLKSLTSLENSPHTVGGYFNCSDNMLTSLLHGPDHVSGGYNCSNNKLSNLTGAPTQVSIMFGCRGNPLISLDGLPNNASSKELYLDIPYTKTLPLLRICLVHNKVVEFSGGLNMASKIKLQEVFNSPEAQGPAGVLQTASVLHQLSQEPRRVFDFEGNAEL